MNLGVLVLSLLGLSECFRHEFTAESFAVHSIPDAPTPLSRIHAGTLPISSTSDRSLFFLHHEAQSPAVASNTIIWFNGGPGCSSMTGAMLEIGPYRLRSDGTLTYNTGSWSQLGNLLFVDNPIGTGFSFADSSMYLTELDEVAEQIVAFLDSFFQIFPEHAMDNLYLAGESFAGQYIPYIARAIVDRNRQSSQQWHLSGLIIGNGWINGASQYPSYTRFASTHNLWVAAEDSARILGAKQEACSQSLINGGGNHVYSSICSEILGDVLNQTQRDGDCFNMYDVRKVDEFPRCGMNYPLELGLLTSYLQRDDVMSSLHIAPGSGEWLECSRDVGAAFTAINSDPSFKLLPDLLAEMPILLYSGDQDFACNYLGTEQLIKDLEWAGSTGFGTVPSLNLSDHSWTLSNVSVGYWQSERNLTYVRLYNASHMVPYDYPERSMRMVHRFSSLYGDTIEQHHDNETIDAAIDPNRAIQDQDAGQSPFGTGSEEISRMTLINAILFLSLFSLTVLLACITLPLSKRRTTGSDYEANE